ncbi:unnamed protein product, partial [Allacma fusca]
ARNPNPFVVHELSFSDICDIKPLKAFLKKPVDLKVTKHLAFKLEREINNIVFTRDTHNPMDVWVPHQVVGKSNQPKPFIIGNPAYTGPQKLTKAKQRDLIKVIKFLDPCDRTFFRKFVTQENPQGCNSDNEDDDDTDQD